MKRLLVLLLVLASAALAACGDDTIDSSDDTDAGNANDAADPSQPDDGAAGDAAAGGTSLSLAGTWLLSGLTVDGATATLPPSELTITIADGMIQGDAGCNTFGGTIDRGDDGSLALGNLAQTEMACEYLDFEIDYTRALLRVDRWEATPDELAFVAEGVRITYSQQPAEAAAPSPLIGTVWALDTVYGPGEGPQRAASSVTPEAEIEAVFDTETLTISSAPCTDAVFDVTVEQGNGGGSFALGAGGATQCEGSELDDANAAIDTAIGALGNATGYLIDGERLILLGDEGELIGFTARP